MSLPLAGLNGGTAAGGAVLGQACNLERARYVLKPMFCAHLVATCSVRVLTLDYLRMSLAQAHKREFPAQHRLLACSCRQ